MANSLLTPASFVKKWAIRFADNEFQNIREGDFREFAADIAAVFGVEVATVPAYQPGITYQKGFLVRYTPAGGQEAFYYSLNAGKLTAPGPGNLVDWKVVPGPTTATALSQELTLVQAQGLDQAGVVAGRTYLIDCGPDANNNTQTLTVRGLANDFFDVEGTLEVNGARTAVTDFNVQAGTWKLKQYGAGVTAAQLAIVATTLPLTTAHTADYTLQANDIGALVPTAGSNPVVLTVAAGLGNAAPAVGLVGAAKVCYPLQLGSGQLSVAAATNVNLLPAPGGGLRAPGPGGRLILTWLDMNTVLVEGGN